MAFTNDLKTVMLDEAKTVVTRVRLLDPDMNEIVDHASASQDKTITWDSTDNDKVTATNEPVFEVKSGITVAAFSYRSTDGATEYARDIIPVESREEFTNNGTFKVTQLRMQLDDPD